ncbi:MAG TPA: hypothetical protein VHS06_12115 [Chloroflexota bacterium]|nr:hypothetical protein [Chloroflexota bacterium]
MVWLIGVVTAVIGVTVGMAAAGLFGDPVGAAENDKIAQVVMWLSFGLPFYLGMRWTGRLKPLWIWVACLLPAALFTGWGILDGNPFDNHGGYLDDELITIYILPTMGALALSSGVAFAQTGRWSVVGRLLAGTAVSILAVHAANSL